MFVILVDLVTFSFLYILVLWCLMHSLLNIVDLLL